MSDMFGGGGGSPTKTFAGAPTGSCNAAETAVDTTTGNFYDCNGGAWNLLSAGGGNTTSSTLVSGKLVSANGVHAIQDSGLTATSVPTSVVNDTNVTGSITSNVLTLGWTGTLAGARQAAMAGDSGSGGTKGAVPAPAAGDAAANKFLKADGTWTAVSGTGTVTHTAGALTLDKMVIGNGSADVAVDASVSTDGSGNLTAVSVATSGSNGGLDLTEGTGAGLTAAPSHDLLWADSTAHRLKVNSNNGGATTLAVFTDNLGVFATGGDTGTGNVVRATSATLTTPNLGTPSAATLTNATGLPEGGLSLTDITTNNVSTSKHGFVPKAPNDATQFLNGTGAWSVPAGGGGSSPILFDSGASVSVVNSTSEQNLMTFTLTGGTMGANDSVTVDALINRESSSTTRTLKFYFGATSIQLESTNSDLSRIITCTIHNLGVTNAQAVACTQRTPANAINNVTTANGTMTATVFDNFVVDSTVNQVIKFTTTASGTDTAHVKQYYMRVSK